MSVLQCGGPEEVSECGSGIGGAQSSDGRAEFRRYRATLESKLLQQQTSQ